MTRISTLPTLTLTLALISHVRADNWPQWRGPAGDGTSRETHLPVKWSETDNVVWKAAIPEWGTSTPAIWNDAIFVTTQTEDGDLLLLKLATKDGHIEWTRNIGKAETPREAEKRTTQKFHRFHNNASPSPTTDGQVVVAHFGNGDLAAFDFTGRELWKHNLQKDYGTYTIWWGHANSPVLYENLVISVCMQDSLSGVATDLAPSYVVAHDKLTGKEVWKTMRMTGADAESGDSYTTPLLHRRGGQMEMIIMGGNQVDAYDPSTGRQLWYLPDIVGGRTITGPTVGSDMVYVTPGMRKDLMGIKLAPSLTSSGKLDEQSIAWRYPENTPDSCSPVIWKDLLFVVTDNGIAQCFDARTGAQHWRERLGGNFKASPVAADGRIYFADMKGLTHVVAASATFEKLAENQVEDETSASPAISGGRIYLRARGHLYCIASPGVAAINPRPLRERVARRPQIGEPGEGRTMYTPQPLTPAPLPQGERGAQ
jgi:outer membrane protein assembly factor BamB